MYLISPLLCWLAHLRTSYGSFIETGFECAGKELGPDLCLGGLFGPKSTKANSLLFRNSVCPDIHLLSQPLPKALRFFAQQPWKVILKIVPGMKLEVLCNTELWALPWGGPRDWLPATVALDEQRSQRLWESDLCKLGMAEQEFEPWSLSISAYSLWSFPCLSVPQQTLLECSTSWFLCLLSVVWKVHLTFRISHVSIGVLFHFFLWYVDVLMRSSVETKHFYPCWWVGLPEKGVDPKMGTIQMWKCTHRVTHFTAWIFPTPSPRKNPLSNWFGEKRSTHEENV